MSRAEEARKAAYEWLHANHDKVYMPSDEFVAGAEWADSHHWYPCDGDYLPKYDEVVLVTLIWEDSEEEEGSHDVTFTTGATIRGLSWTRTALPRLSTVLSTDTGAGFRNSLKSNIQWQE